MELRVLEYFLALAREGSVSAAAEVLHVSQPTLSRQLQDLERELGCTLFERGHRGITLTPDGMHLRRRAGEIVDLARATRSELLLGRGAIAGRVSIGCAETRAMAFVAQAMRSLHDDHPSVTFDVVSATAERVVEDIGRGLLDFGLLLRRAHTEGLEHLRIASVERAVVLLREGSPLRSLARLSPKDLEGEPLIVPASHRESGMLGGMEPEGDGGTLNVVATYNLAYNAVRMAEAGLGSVVTLEGLVGEAEAGGLEARPLDVTLDMPSYLVWKPSRTRTRACEAFLERARGTLPLA